MIEDTALAHLLTEPEPNQRQPRLGLDGSQRIPGRASSVRLDLLVCHAPLMISI
jgi:hypothetical protein